MEVIRQKNYELDSLPIDRIPDPAWQLVFRTPILDLQKPITAHEQATFRLQKIIEGKWIVGLHWCFKMKYWHKYKIPIKSKIAQDHKELGAFIRSILELAIQCHALPSDDSNQYKNAAEWFHLIIKEQVFIGQNATKKSGKRRSIDNDRKKIQAIRGSGKSTEFETEVFQQMAEETPHFYQLIRRAKILSAGSHNSDFWRVYMVGKGNKSMTYPNLGLLTAWGKWLKHLESSDNVSPFWVDGEDIFAQRGRGRDVVKVIPKISAESLTYGGFTSLMRCELFQKKADKL